MKDYVKCCNCGFIGLVDIGQEECPECKFSGALAWADDKEDIQEVEDWLEDFKNGKVDRMGVEI